MGAQLEAHLTGDGEQVPAIPADGNRRRLGERSAINQIGGLADSKYRSSWAMVSHVRTI